MSDSSSESRPIGLSSGPPTTVLPEVDAPVRHALAQALAAPEAERRSAVAAVVAAYPRLLDGWAALAAVESDVIARYAAARVGYHRGLDALRANGWRGSGYVPWAHRSNHGFLLCLLGLQNAAASIGEADEAERCALFLLQLDPRGVPAEFGAIAPVTSGS
jgi:hypothetical protein